MISLKQEDLASLFVGSAFFSCGGGVPYEKSIALTRSSMRSSETRLLSFEDFCRRDWLCTVYAIGVSGQGNKDYALFIEAITRLERYAGIKISGIIPGEIGSEINAIWTANRLNLAVVDSDMVGGRAVPEEQMDLYGLNGIASTPAVVVNDKSDVLIVEKAHDPVAMEQVYRAFAVASGGYCYIASRPIQRGDAEAFMPPGTLSRSIVIGQHILNSKSEGRLVEELQNLCGSKLLAKGKVAANHIKNDPGFLSGNIRIDGSEAYDGSEFTVYYKNENILMLLGTEYACSAPDLISVVNAQSLMPVANSSLHEGMEVLVFGTPVLPIWKTEKGVSLLGPKQFGLDWEYVPL